MAAVRHGHQADAEIRAQIVADLQDQPIILRERRRKLCADPPVAAVAVG
jgi:hypothetical protein